MKLQGERLIPATVEATWNALNDPQTLQACITGCESIETTGENQYLALMAVRIGPVNAKFKGRLQLEDIVPLTSYTIRFDGQGGVAGFGKGSAQVRLTPENDDTATRLTYVADAQVGGKIAQIGSRLVEAAAGKITDDFFKAFEARMTGPGPGDEAAGPIDQTTAAAADELLADTRHADPQHAGTPPAAARADEAARGTPPGPATSNRMLMWIAAAIAAGIALFLLVR